MGVLKLVVLYLHHVSEILNNLVELGYLFALEAGYLGTLLHGASQHVINIGALLKLSLYLVERRVLEAFNDSNNIVEFLFRPLPLPS